MIHATLNTSRPTVSVTVLVLLVLGSFLLGAENVAQAQGVQEIFVPGSPAGARLWTGPDGSVFFSVSEDGLNFSRPTRADYRLLLRHGPFDPLLEVPDVLPHLVAVQGQWLAVVQYWTQGLEAYRNTLRRMGVEILFFMPNYADVVAMDPAVASAAAALPFVRSVIPFQPAFKLEKELKDAMVHASGELIKVNLLTTRRGSVSQRPVERWVEARGGRVIHVSPLTYLMTVTLPVNLLAELAALDDVQWIDRWAAPEVDMNIARSFHGANYVETLAGVTGQGVRVEVMDGGCETTHPDIQNFAVHSPTNIASNHGTATSGIVVGSGSGNASARGVLPSAFLSIGYYNSFAGGSRYAHSAELVNPGLSWQCVLQSNSWGNGRTRSYTSYSQEMDQILFDLENLSILQSQSNAGNQDSRPQAWAKNIISVGGIYHNDTLTKADDAWASGASIGPAADGRIKPDLASFYDDILCTDRVGTNGYTSTNYISYFGGTSGATPIVAGHLGLFYQLWHQGVFGNPHPGTTVFQNAPKNTTAKAFLINTATQWTFSGSNHDLTRTHQGWGHPDIQRMYDLRNKVYFVDESDVLGNLQSTTHNLTVAPGTAALKATLVFRDPPGTTSSTQHRINNLDLKVESPSSTVYHGNNGLVSGMWSSSGGSPNTIDTVENVFVQNPAAGIWKITVTAAELNQDAHPETTATDADYALVVTGATLQSGPTAPAAPSGLNATATGTTSISLGWIDNAGNEDGFQVERSMSSTGPFAQIASVGANVTNHNDTGLSPGTTYYYRVRAFNTVGLSGYSNIASATTQVPAPAAPSDLMATLNGSSRIDLSWTDNSSNEEGFRIERSVNGGGFSFLVNVGADVTGHADQGLAGGTTYAYRVRAFNSGGPSPWSNTATKTTPSVYTDYTATGETPDTGKVNGTYTDTQTANTVYQSIQEVVSGKKKRTKNELEHRYQFTGIPAGAKSFRVKAYKTVSADGDNFTFQYLNTTKKRPKWATMLTVTRTIDSSQYQTFALPSGLTGTVSVRVVDTNSTRGGDPPRHDLHRSHDDPCPVGVRYSPVRVPRWNTPRHAGQITLLIPGC